MAQWAQEQLYAILVGYSGGRYPQAVLVYRYHLGVQHDVARGGVHRSEVARHGQRRGHHGPHAHLCAVLGVGTSSTAAVARRSALAIQSYHQHVHVEPASAVGMCGEWCCYVDDVEYAHSALVHNVLPHVAHVTAGAVYASACLVCPVLRLVRSPLTYTQHYLASALVQCVGHGLVAPVSLCTVVGCIAVVIFKVVYAPRGKGACILLLKPIACGISGTGKLCRIGVDAQLQPLGVYIVGQGLYAARKLLGVGYQVVAVVASSLPAVVYKDVFIAGIAVAALHHGIGRLAYQLFVDVSLKLVPGHPSHRGQWCQRQALLGHDAQWCAHEQCQQQVFLLHIFMMFFVRIG